MKRRGTHVRTRIVLGVMTATFAVAASTAHASAINDFTWTGGAPAGATAWSNASNWTSSPTAGQTPSATIGSLTFPALPGCNTSANACLASNNDVSGITASSLTIDDGTPYQVSGQGISLGSGGIHASMDAGDLCCDTPAINNDIALTANQTWNVDGGSGAGQGFGQLALNGNVTGSSFTLGVTLPNQAFLGLAGDVEVGNVTATSSTNDGFIGLGFPGQPGALNATDGHTVNLTNTGLFAFGSIGALTASGSHVQIGQPDTAATLSVSGDASLDSTSAMSLFITHAGTTPGTDASQFSATGNIDITNADLVLSGAATNGLDRACPVLTVNDVYTLVQTTGGGKTITGTFTGIPQDTTVPVQCSEYGFAGTDPTVKIHYNSTSVTATVMTAGSNTSSTTTTLATPSPSSPVTNQTVALTATVDAGGSAPQGTVTFKNGGTAISGCSGRPLTFNSGAGTYQATCSTAFAASTSPESLTASFTGTTGSGFGNSDSSAQPLTVGKDGTSTGLGVSNASPATGDSVTFTATVGPSHSGATEPSGTVAFSDNGNAISTCASQPLTQGASSSTATCTISYAGAGAHTITASYGGDASFTGSSSAGQVVTVSAPAAGSSGAGTTGGTSGTTGGTAGTTGGTTGTPSAPTTAQLLAGLVNQLGVSGPGAKIAAILRAGGYTMTFTALGPGKVLIDWYFLPPGARLATAKPVLVAKGSKSFAGAGKARVKLALTPAGKKLLKHSKRLKLTAKGTFTPAAGKAVSWKKTLSLKR